MISGRIASIALVTVGLLAFGWPAEAEVFVEHVGNNNPTSEIGGWSQYGKPGELGLTGTLPNWRTEWDISVHPSNYYRVVGNSSPVPSNDKPIDDAIDDPSGWTATWKVQLVSADSFSEIYFQVHDGDNTFDLRLYDGLQAGGDPLGAYAYFGSTGSGQGPQLKLGTVDPTDDFHTYQLVLDAKDNLDRSDDEIFWYLDGVQQHNFLRPVLPKTLNNRAEMGIYRTGNSYDGTPSIVRHNIWRLESGQNPCTPGDDMCPLPPPPVTTGDYNGDGTVNAADYTVWQDTLGDVLTLAGTGADGDESGTIDAGDYTFWKDRFGDVIASGTTATVPEPCSLMLMSLVMLKLVVFRFGRHRTAGRMGSGI